MRNNEKRPVAWRNYVNMWRSSRAHPLPHRLRYCTWLEWGNYDLDGRLAEWFVYPACAVLDWAMRWWPHQHVAYREAAHRPEMCVYCRKVLRREP